MDEQTKMEIWDLAAGTFIAVSVVSGMAYIMPARFISLEIPLASRDWPVAGEGRDTLFCGADRGGDTEGGTRCC